MITERLFDKRVKPALQEQPDRLPIFPVKETWPWKPPKRDIVPELHGLRVYHIPTEQIGVVKWQHGELVGLCLHGGRFQQCTVDEVSVLNQ